MWNCIYFGPKAVMCNRTSTHSYYTIYNLTYIHYQLVSEFKWEVRIYYEKVICIGHTGLVNWNPRTIDEIMDLVNRSLLTGEYKRGPKLEETTVRLFWSLDRSHVISKHPVVRYIYARMAKAININTVLENLAFSCDNNQFTRFFYRLFAITRYTIGRL